MYADNDDARSNTLCSNRFAIVSKGYEPYSAKRGFNNASEADLGRNFLLLVIFLFISIKVRGLF